jgi:hypothetical protein
MNNANIHITACYSYAAFELCFSKKNFKASNLIHKPHPFVMGNGKNVIHATHILHG